MVVVTILTSTEVPSNDASRIAQPTPKILGVDAGGTFTDFVCIEMCTPINISIHKTLSTPAAPEQAIMQGILAMGLDSSLHDGSLQIVHGSTVATNAVLEGKVARTAFVTNYGFADMLQLARQTRPSLYELEFPEQPPPVDPSLCLETGGRISADGEELEPLSEIELSVLIDSLRELAPEAVAVNLLFSFVDERYEKAICEAIEAAGLPIFVSRSSQVLPEYKEYERGIATWLNASLGPIVQRYLGELQRLLGAIPLQIMQSSGETIGSARAAQSAVNLLLSGPAGGLKAMEYLAAQTATNAIVSFDMGGTSTDVALFDGAIATTNEGTIAQYPVGVAMVDMHTIGAGGGSMAFVDGGGMLQVGPDSAGADPGPACYGRGGKVATVTDANLVLGRLLPQVALAGGLKLNLDLATAAIEPLAAAIGLSVQATAEGIVSIANEHMAKAIRMISVNRGFDAKEFVLASFGGAGGLHVCALADAMLMPRAMVPIHGGVLSALGMVVANRGRAFSKTLKLGQRHDDSAIIAEFARLEQRASEELQREGLLAAELVVKRSVDMRYLGQAYTLNLVWQNLQQAQQAFSELHLKRYGYVHEVAIELVNLRATVLAPTPSFDLPRQDGSANAQVDGQVTGHATTNACNKLPPDMVYSEQVTVIERSAMLTGCSLLGPAVISEYSSTTYVAPNWVASVDEFGNILLQRRA